MLLLVDSISAESSVGNERFVHWWLLDMFAVYSNGCIHAHPDDLKTIDAILKELGVKVRPNPFLKQPYPYQPQGLLSVEEIVSVRPPSTEDY